MEWIVQLPILMLSVVVHEVSHGLAAYARGDDTAEQAGRLTLNPLPHVDPFSTVFLPMFCYAIGLPMFGWAKPVPVNGRRLKSPRRDWILVALAGPGSNLLLAVGVAVVFKAVTLAHMENAAFRETLLNALLFGVSINMLLAFFNLVPVHPLDGSKVLGGLLPLGLRRGYDRLAPYGMFLLLFLMMTRLFDPIVVEPSRMAIGLLHRAGLL